MGSNRIDIYLIRPQLGSDCAQECDVSITPLELTPERQQTIIFSEILMYEPYVIMTNIVEKNSEEVTDYILNTDSNIWFLLLVVCFHLILIDIICSILKSIHLDFELICDHILHLIGNFLQICNIFHSVRISSLMTARFQPTNR